LEINPTTVTIFGLAIAGIVWLVRQEGRINAALAKQTEMDSDLYKHTENTDIHPKVTEIDKKFNDLKADLKADIHKVDASVEKLSDLVVRVLAK
jgi:hypothetical protein